MDKEKQNISKKKKADMSITATLLIAILVVVNFLSYNIFYRFDLTENKIYSISDASKSTLGELDDVVNINAYFSENLPTQLLSVRQEIEDMFDEYVTYSGGKVKVNYINPSEDEQLQQELYAKGIPQLQFEVIEKDTRQLVNGYLGITINFADSEEVIPIVKQNVSDLEYQLTTKIKKVTTSEIATIGYLTSQGVIDRSQQFTSVMQELSELYQVRDVELSEEDPQISPSIDTLIIAGPTQNFSDDQLKAINDFAVSGGAILYLQDGVTIGDGLLATPRTTGLESLFSKYGLTLKNDLVADQKNAMAQFSQGFFSFSVAYPFWPKFSGSSFNQDYSAVSSLENVVLPWVSSIEIDEEKLSDEAVAILIETTDKSWVQNENFQIVPNQIPSVASGLKKHKVAVMINGSVSNPYYEEGQTDSFVAKIVIVADSDFGTDNFVANNPDNINLFLNLVDSLSLDEDLIKIRSKVATSRPIDSELEDSDRAFLRYFNVFGITAIVVIFGVGRYFMRRRNRFVDDL
ncbi:hypothetical protein C0583_04055 [Candidatus Parcubacteria bacterium]|nr:MAG: hypothetical protein C0583_04055 [Candidatus Parcubacteria bacterium]